MQKELKFPVYDRNNDGNVFFWILEASNDFRKIRQRERYLQLEALTNTHANNEKQTV